MCSEQLDPKAISFFFPIVYLAVPGLSCSVWDLVPQPGIEPGPLHWDRRVLGTGPAVCVCSVASDSL